MIAIIWKSDEGAFKLSAKSCRYFLQFVKRLREQGGGRCKQDDSLEGEGWYFQVPVGVGIWARRPYSLHRQNACTIGF